MSKELNIIEASNMPIGTEFKVVYEKVERSSNLIINDNNNLVNITDGRSPKIFNELINAKFIPIQKPVSFMEAINTDKNIMVNNKNCDFGNKYMKVSDMLYHLSFLDCYLRYVLINNCEWYIEEN